MPSWPFRFIHAADFHLETPPFGVSEVPEHLRELFIESAYWAAERVFETALGEEVDFLILSGDILHCRHTGPRGPLFLADQFERLDAQKIDVYWAAGLVDGADNWPPSIRLPGNVHLFPQGKPEEFIYRREGTPLVRLIGAGRAKKGRIRTADFDPREPGLFAIAVTHGRAEAASFDAARVDYWALGGRHDRRTLSRINPLVHYPGSPQGRQPEEIGPHGCTLVRVDDRSRIQASLATTDVIRWQSEQIEISDATSSQQLESLLFERAHSLAESAAGIDQLVSWTICGSGPLLTRLRSTHVANQFLAKLRNEFGMTQPSIWSTSLAANMTAVPPREWYEPSTIRGDFLRSVDQLKRHAGEPLGLERYLPEDAADDILAVALTGKGDGRLSVLHDAALLGVDLLTGEEARS